MIRNFLRPCNLLAPTAALLALLSGISPELKAGPAPQLTSISPEWIQRGKPIEITLSGENLTNATRILFSNDTDTNQTIKASDLKFKDNKTLTARLETFLQSPLGEHELRVVTASGVSEPLILYLGELPETLETGTNNTPESAQTILLPTAVNGIIKAPAATAYYRFHARKEDLVVLDLFASRMGSPLDSSLAVLNLGGRELARNEDANGLDSLIKFSPPAEGDYIVQLRDFRYQGGGDYKYRLYAGTIPCLDSIFPLGGRRGETVELQLEGSNLTPDQNGRLTMPYKIPSTSPTGASDIRATGSGLSSNPRLFEIGDLPESLEAEPNDTAETANRLTVPLTLNGRIGKPHDVDTFIFKSETHQRLICEVTSQRLGSPLDPLLILTDSSGKVLSQNDDAAGMDARIDYDKFNKDQEYRLSVRDLNDRGGNSFGYRLSVHPIEPDFHVKYFSDIPRITPGGHATIRCEVTRIGGFQGAVRIEFEGLPPGLYAEPVVLTTDPSSGLLILSAASDAAPGHFPIRLNATAMINDKRVSHTADPVIAGQKPRKNRRGNRSPEDRVVNDAFLTVLDTPPFVLDLLSLRAEADQNQSATLQVRAYRLKDFTNDIELTAEGYSSDREPITKHFDIPTVKLNPDQSRAKLVLNARSTAETGTRTIVIKGTAIINGETNIQYSSAIPLTVNPIPFGLDSSLPRLSVTALPPGSKSAAGEAVFSIKADRRAGFAGEISLSIEGLPEGIVASFDKIPANQNEANVRITATGKAPIGKEVSFTFLGTGMFNDRNYKYRTPAIRLTVIAPEETLTSATK